MEATVKEEPSATTDEEAKASLIGDGHVVVENVAVLDSDEKLKEEKIIDEMVGPLPTVQDVTEGVVPEPKYQNITAVPSEMWWKICSYLTYDEQKTLREVHPLIFKVFKTYKSFYERTTFKMPNQETSVFKYLADAEEDFTWGQLELEIVNAVFRTSVPPSFYGKYSSRLTKLSLGNCFVNIPEDSSEFGRFWLASILDQCPVVNTLKICSCSNFLPPTSTEDYIVHSDEVKWPSIKTLTLVRNKFLTGELAIFILSRVAALQELNVIGVSKNLPGTKPLWKKISEEKKTQWRDDAKWIKSVVLPYIIAFRLSLKTLTISNHFLLAEEDKKDPANNFVGQIINVFKDRMGHFDFDQNSEGDLVRRRTPKLEKLDLTMCEVTYAQLAELMGLTLLTSITCWLKNERRCRHEKPGSLPTVPGHPSKSCKRCHIYRSPLNEKVVGKIKEFNIPNSVSLDCLCFVGQMLKLEHLDVSYCPNLRSTNLFNGNGPTYGPHSDKWKMNPKLAVAWKLKTFKFAGNQQAKFDIKKLILFNVTHLDLSYSDCILNNKDFVHICDKFRKLKILKLSGSTGVFRLNRLKSLKQLVELRLRGCRNIDPIQLEENLMAKKLSVLDIGKTKVTAKGVLNIIAQNRCLTFVDLRGCDNIGDMKSLESVIHVSLLTGNLDPKRKVQKKESVEEEDDADTSSNEEEKALIPKFSKVSLHNNAEEKKVEFPIGVWTGVGEGEDEKKNFKQE